MAQLLEKQTLTTQWRLYYALLIGAFFACGEVGAGPAESERLKSVTASLVASYVRQMQAGKFPHSRGSWPRGLQEQGDSPTEPACAAGSKLWLVTNDQRQLPSFLFGSYHFDVDHAWPLLPANNRLALESCDAVYAEVDLHDHNIADIYTDCMVLPGNAYSRGRGWPVHTTSGQSLQSLLSDATW